MPSSTSLLGISYSLATDEIKGFPAEVSAPGAKTIDKYLEEHLTLVKEHGASFTAATGELIKATANITVTLPVASANAVVELLSNGHEVTLGAGAALIYGDFITGTTPINFIGYQHVRVVSDGTNWFVTAGEPKRTAGYTEPETARTEKTEYTPSATRETLVIAEVEGKTGVSQGAFFTVGGLRIGGPIVDANFMVGCFTFLCPAGIKWKWEMVNEKVNVRTTYLIR